MAGNTTIATFNTQSEAARSLRAVEKVSFSLEDAQELAGFRQQEKQCGFAGNVQ